MTKSEFVKWIYEAAVRVSDISPVFITAQAALESGWGQHVIGKYNLFGITKGSNWTGRTILVTTHEVFNSNSVKFNLPEKVLEVDKLPIGKYRYTVKRLFKDFDSIDDCLKEHLRILQKEGYADAWKFRKCPKVFAQKISDGVGCKYATDPNYYRTMCAMIDTVNKFIG